MDQQSNISAGVVEGVLDQKFVDTLLEEFEKMLKSEMNRRIKYQNTCNMHRRRRTTSTKEEESFVDSYNKEECVGQRELLEEKTILFSMVKEDEEVRRKITSTKEEESFVDSYDKEECVGQGELLEEKTTICSMVKEDEEVHNQRTITLVPLTTKQVHEDKVSLQKESEKKELSENEGESKKKIEKIEWKNKEKECDIERKINSYAKSSEVKRAIFSCQPMIELLSIEAFFSIQLDESLPSFLILILQDFDDVFHGLKWGRMHMSKGRQKLIFDPGGDLRTNHFQEGGNDEDKGEDLMEGGMEDIEGLGGPI